MSVTGGSFGYGRFLGAASPKVGKGNLLTAFEWERDNGPWVSPNNKDKFNGVVRYSQGNARNGLSLTFLGFRNHWHSTDQIPQRAVDSGEINRFGFIEETDGGETFRYAGAFDWQRSRNNDSTRLTAYVQRYGVQLFHNFTYFLNDPENGDQFEQFEERWTSGAKLDSPAAGRDSGKTRRRASFGVDLRNDDVGGPLGLYHTRETERLDTIRADEVNQTSVGMFGDTEIEWSRTCAHDVRPARRRLQLERGLQQPAELRRQDIGASSARRSRRRSAPGAAPSSTPTGGSASTRTPGSASCCNVDPVTGDPATQSPSFARSQGAEFGVRTRGASRGLQTTATLWYLDFDSELIYVGDSGSTEEGPASRRIGVEITNYIYPHPWVARRPRHLVLARALPRRAGGRGLRARRAQPRHLGGIGVNPPAGVSVGPVRQLPRCATSVRGR